MNIIREIRLEPVAVAAAFRAVALAVMAWGVNMEAEAIAATAIAIEAVLGIFVRKGVTPYVAPLSPLSE